MVVQSDGNCKESCATDSSVRYGYIRIRCDHRSEVIHDAINVVVVNLKLSYENFGASIT